MNDILSGKQLAEEANKAYQSGEYQKAAQLFKASSTSYLKEGNELVAAEQLNNCSVAFLQANQAQEALDACEGTVETFSKLGSLKQKGMALGNLGSALEALGEYPQALVVLQQSTEILEQIGEDQLRANVMQSISRIKLRQGHHYEALSTMQEGLEGINKPNLKQGLLKKILNLPAKLLNGKL